MRFLLVRGGGGGGACTLITMETMTLKPVISERLPHTCMFSYKLRNLNWLEIKT